MVYRWRCRRCAFTTWSSSDAHLERKIKAHAFDHHRGSIAKVDFRVGWECPTCGEEGQSHDKVETVRAFKDHLYDHLKGEVVSGVHVADDIDRRGNVLVKAPIESDGANNARTHFLSVGNVLVLVTQNPAERIRLLDETLSEWPTWTVVITTKRRPLEEPMEIDFTDIPIEVVKLDQSMGPTGLGETISRVVDEHHRQGVKLSVAFDILPELIDTFDLKQSYKFLDMLSTRLEEVGALSQFYFDPQPQSATALNVINDQFDMELNADGPVFTTTERPSG